MHLILLGSPQIFGMMVLYYLKKKCISIFCMLQRHNLISNISVVFMCSIECAAVLMRVGQKGPIIFMAHTEKTFF